MNTIHVIDLKSIVDIDTKIELISKDNPDKVLLRIPHSDLALLQSGWQKYKKRVYYNGKTYWLHPDILSKLHKKYQNPNLLGIRITNDYQKKFEVDTILLKRVSRQEPIIILLEESPELKIKNRVIKEIEYTLKSKGFNIFQFKTLTPKFEPGLHTVDVLLELLTGYKVKSDAFSESEATQFKNANYYDKNSEVLNYIEDISTIFKFRLDNTETDLQKTIYKNLKDNKDMYMLSLYQIVSNKDNPVKKDTMQLNIEQTFKYLESFNSFKT